MAFVGGEDVLHHLCALRKQVESALSASVKTENLTHVGPPCVLRHAGPKPLGREPLGHKGEAGAGLVGNDRAEERVYVGRVPDALHGKGENDQKIKLQLL